MKRYLGFLLVLVMLVGMIPATVLTANAAGKTMIGVEIKGSGYKKNGTQYSIDFDSIYLVADDGSKQGCYSNSMLFTDEACTMGDFLLEEPELGETYYFWVKFSCRSDVVYDVVNANSTFDIEGFAKGKVVDAVNYGDSYIVTCSIMYGELTGGVKAVASGVEYDSELGGYAPAFTTLKAVSTEGKELEAVKIPDGDHYYSYYEATSGALYKTNAGTSFSNMLTTEPQEGETYYSYILLDSIDGNLWVEEDLVNIRIPGYDVEFIDAYERDMGFTSLVVYSVTKQPEYDVYVAGVGMNDGDYLANGSYTTTKTQPSGGYAYYNDGGLVLYNYTYSGLGHRVSDSMGAMIYAPGELNILLAGSNKLSGDLTADEEMVGIYACGLMNLYGTGSMEIVDVDRGLVTDAQNSSGLYATISVNSSTLSVTSASFCIAAEGKVSITKADLELVSTGNDSNSDGIYAMQDITVTSSTVVVDATNNGIYSEIGDVTFGESKVSVVSVYMGIYAYNNVIVNSGSVTTEGYGYGIYAEHDVVINGGRVSAKSLCDNEYDESYPAIRTDGTCTFASSVTVEASTEAEGTLGAYVKENHSTYDWIRAEGPCVDEDQDHLCDNCGEVISYCADTNKDSKCDICGAELEDPGELVGPGVVTRLAGANRWATSLIVADALKETMGVDKFDAIIIASGNNFADALAGSYLATVKGAPILLSYGYGGAYAVLDENNIEYVRNNLAENGTVYILGGKSAVPGLYDVELADLNVKRLGGANRFETNLLILEEAGVPAGSQILVCTSSNFADSLSASATGKPILLVWNERGELYGRQAEFLESLNVCYRRRERSQHQAGRDS